MSNLADLFKGLDDADIENRKPKLDDGRFHIEVIRNDMVEGYQSGQSYLIEFKIVECLVPELTLKFPAGRELSATINRLDDRKQENRDLALSNLKAYLAAALSHKMGHWIDPMGPQPWTQIAAQTVASKTALAGCQLIVQVDTIRTKGGFDFKKHTWSPLPQFAQPVAG